MQAMRHLFAVLAVLLLAGCGGSSGAATTSGRTTAVSLALDWYPNADHVGVYTGIDRGFFRRAGLFQNIEGIQLAREGLHPVVFPYDRYGVPGYDELVVVANASKLHDDSGYRRAVARFVSALGTATRWARTHPAAATRVMAAHA